MYFHKNQQCFITLPNVGVQQYSFPGEVVFTWMSKVIHIFLDHTLSDLLKKTPCYFVIQ